MEEDYKHTYERIKEMRKLYHPQPEATVRR
jgi:hypothetical protein